jgi:hypothetical protein
MLPHYSTGLSLLRQYGMYMSNWTSGILSLRNLSVNVFNCYRFIDEDQLVVNLKKVEQELKWPDVDESWKSLTSGITQLLTGISIHIVGDSTEINELVAKEIAEGIGCVITVFHNALCQLYSGFCCTFFNQFILLSNFEICYHKHCHYCDFYIR